MPLIDAQGRKHDYLRISVTDRCNLRCRYCMGEEGVEQLTHNDILSYEDIVKVVTAGAELGLAKIRITGGEPLVRNGIISLVEKIAAIDGITDLSMTTNGILLPRYAQDLKNAGLNRVNISLDSLNPERYHLITRCGELKQVLKGIETALELNLHPVKLNVVLMKGLNDDEVIDFLQLIINKPLHVRFIEYMPIGDQDNSRRDLYLPLNFIENTAEKAGLPLKPAPLPGGAGPAEAYTIPGSMGTIGLIHPISKHFCNSCNRLRLTADGKLKACLYWQDELPVKPVINDHEALKRLIRTTLAGKPVEHQMAAQGFCGAVKPEAMRSMSKIGG